MKKELFFTILIGLSLGLILTYGMYRAKNSQQGISTEIIPSTPLPSPSSSDSTTNLLISNPEDESITESQKIQIIGSTSANAFVIIFVNDDETIITADTNGNFTTERELKPGANIINIIAINEDGRSTQTERTVILAPEFLQQINNQNHEN